MGLNDTAWQALFDKYDILDEIQRSGQFVISANQIKEFREPRLMTKFDHKVNLPTVFADNGLAILPITRGDYVKMCIRDSPGPKSRSDGLPRRAHCGAQAGYRTG